MTPTVKMNFQSDKKFANKLWSCDSCVDKMGIGVRDTQQHVMICPAYNHFRQGKDLSRDKELVEYFRNVIKVRTKEH